MEGWGWGIYLLFRIYLSISNCPCSDVDVYIDLVEVPSM